jgi:hypothetical protein
MAQVNKISSFKSFTEVKNQEASIKLREENNAKRQETVGKIGAILDEMGLTSLSELDEKQKQVLINKMFGNVSEDEAEDIEDELNKLGKTKKLEEGNAFIYAAAKAKNAGKKTFQFNGKTYKVTLKTDTGLREDNVFEIEGETYKIEEAKRTKFTGKSAHDLYTQINGQPAEVFIKNNWYSVNPLELQGDKSSYFTGYTGDGSDYEFDVKDIDFIQESVESIDEAATDLVKYVNDAAQKTFKAGGNGQNLIDNATELAYHIENYALGRDTRGYEEDGFYGPATITLFKRLVDQMSSDDAKNNNNSKYESVSSIDEGRSIAKIQYDWSKLTTTMAATAQNWKAAEGPAKEALLAKLKEMTAQKKALEAELDAAIADKDKDIELVVTESKENEEASNILDDILGERDMEEVHGMSMEDALVTVKTYGHTGSKAKKIAEELWGMCNEAFNRLPKDVIGNELYLASQNLTNLYSSAAAGNDIDTGVIDSVVRQLNTIKKSVKKFNKPEEVVGTIYEGKAKDLKPNHKYTSDYGEVTFIKLNPDGKTMKLYSKETGEIKTDISNAYNMELIESVVNEAEKFKSTQDFEEFLEEIDGMPEVRIRRIMGDDYIDTPGGFRDEADDYDNDIVEYTLSNMGRKDFEALKAWWENNVQESVNEAAAKQFDVDFNNMVKNIKSGYGWIDPEYVGDTWENSSTSIDFELVKGEIFKRLFDAGLLIHPEPYNSEAAGKKVKFSELGAYTNESVVNEADMTKYYDGFIVLDFKNKKTYKFKYIKGSNNVNVENIAISKLMKATGLSQANFTVHGFVRKGEWNTDKTPVFESQVNEGSFSKPNEMIDFINKNQLHFAAFLKPKKLNVLQKGDSVIISPASGSFTITVDYTKSTIDSTGKPKWPESTSYIELIEWIKHVTQFKVLNESAEVNEAEIKSEAEFKEYAMTVLKKAFGDDFDEAKAGEAIDGILGKCGDDYGACVGMLTSSLGESVVTEAFDANYWEDYHDSGESGKIKNPGNFQIKQEVEACVEDWNDNNENGPENEVTPAGEKKVLALAYQFVKAKGYISSDIIDAMIAQES